MNYTSSRLLTEIRTRAPCENVPSSAVQPVLPDKLEANAEKHRENIAPVHGWDEISKQPVSA
jgi:hypothetical protein